MSAVLLACSDPQYTIMTNKQCNVFGENNAVSVADLQCEGRVYCRERGKPAKGRETKLLYNLVI